MLIHYNEDEYETISAHSTCAFHQKNPGKPYAGCTCSSSMISQRRSPEEIVAIKARRQREHEDRILAEAEAIKARRSN